ncbi:MAG: hypothetical protein IPK16_19835 [Anaerolineales bacterium]|nr:hypothetical protein [Anaerolineales bacterium]
MDDLKSDLLGYLVNIPAVDTLAERKALIISARASSLSNEIDWSGSKVEFFTNLLDAVGRHDQTTLVNLLAGLAGAPQINDERRAQLAPLQSKVAALDINAWRQSFAVVQTPAQPRAERAPDPDMVLATIINDVLAPYYRIGAAQYGAKAGAPARALAEQATTALEQSLAADATGSLLFNQFKQQPEAMAPAILPLLKARFTQDPALLTALAALIDKANADPQRTSVSHMIEVAQTTGAVSGNVVGAILGADVVSSISSKITVNQHTGDIGPGGAVVGAVLGSPGQLNIGGQQHTGDTVQGNQQKVESAKGPAVGGDVKSGGMAFGDIQGSGDVIIASVQGSGVAVGKDIHQSVSQPAGVQGQTVLDRMFATVNKRIDARADDPNVEKDEIRELVQKIREEAAKGGAANDEVGTVARRINHCRSGHWQPHFGRTSCTRARSWPANQSVGAAPANRASLNQTQALPSRCRSI